MSAEEEFEKQVHAQMERLGQVLNDGGIERDGPTTMAMLNFAVEALVASGMPRELFLDTCGAMFDWYHNGAAAD